MSFNGSGTFNINSAGQPVVSGTVISSSTFNTLTADLATGLSTCITKDGQTTVTANIPMNSYKITGLAAGTAATDAARVGQLQAGAASVVTAAGTDTYTGTMSPSLGAYAVGNTFTFVVPNTNTTAATLNIDGLGAKALTRDGSTALVAGDLVANAEVLVVYDGTRFQVLNSNSKTNFNLSGTLTVAGNTTLSGGTANGVAYLNASKVLTSGSVFTYSANGNLVLGVPTTGTALAVTGTSGTYAVDITSTNTSINNRALNVYNSAATGTTALTNHILRLASNGSGADCTLQFTDSVANNGYIGMKSGALNFGANTTTTQMTITTAGRLGIGTTSPSDFLGISGGGIRIEGWNADATFIQQQLSASYFQRVAGDATNRQLRLESNSADGGASGSIVFRTSSSGTLATTMTLDGAGNLGLGVTPSAWGSNARVIQMAGTGAVFGQTNANIVSLTENMYWDNTNFKYIATDTAAKYTLYQGQHIWQNAASGTAGTNITLTTAMTLQSTGYLKATGPNTMLYTGLNIHEFVGAAARVLNISSASASYTDQALTVSVSTAPGTGWLIFSGENTAGQAIKIYGNGNVQNSNNSYGAISDVKLKENITDASPKLADLMQVRVRNYNFKSDPGHKQLGVVAQELKQIFPNMIEESPDKDAEGNDLGTTTKGVKYSVFVPMLIKAMQEQQALIESLTARLNALENK